jgi:hypothetical protein
MNFKGFSLGVVDILGIIIPGIIWVSLIGCVHILYPTFLNSEYSTISCLIIKIFPGNLVVANSFLFVFMSYLVGYVSRLIPPRFLDRVTVSLASVGTGKKFKDVWNLGWKEKVHPYNFLYQSQSEALGEMQVGMKDFGSNSNYFQTFFIGKRMILLHSATLWSDAQRREAEIRLINGIFYSVLSTAILFFAHAEILLGLFFLSVTLFLALAFRRRRYAEVAFVLSATFVIINNLQRETRKASME